MLYVVVYHDDISLRDQELDFIYSPSNNLSIAEYIRNCKEGWCPFDVDSLLLHGTFRLEVV